MVHSTVIIPRICVILCCHRDRSVFFEFWMLFRRTLEGELVEKSVPRIRLINAVFGKTQRAGLKTYTYMKMIIVMKNVIGATISNSYGYLA